MVVLCFIRWAGYLFTVDSNTHSFVPLDWAGTVFGASCVITAVLIGLLSKLYPSNVAKYWKDGRVGVGTVESYQHIGLKKGIRNYELKMQVEGEDGAINQRVLSVPVGRRRVDALHQGQRLPVIYRASKPAKLYVPHGPLRKRAQLFYDYVCVRDGLIDQHTLNAGYFGQPARAVVTQVSSEGLIIPGKERLHFAVDVFTPDGRQFASRATVLADSYQKDLLARARYVEARYLPHAPERVALRIPKAPKVG